MEILLKVKSGEKIPYIEQVKGLYDITPQYPSDSEIYSAVERIDSVYEGSGSLLSRISGVFTRRYLPKEIIMQFINHAMKLVRERTYELFPNLLPKKEHIEISQVYDTAWEGYNWYLGDFRSRFDMCIDRRISWHLILDVAAHEGYPGHHVMSCVKDKLLYQEKGIFEQSIRLAFSPQMVLYEGIADLALELLYNPYENEKIAYENYCINPSEENREDLVIEREAWRTIHGIHSNFAYHLFVEEWTEKELFSFLLNLGIYPERVIHNIIRLVTIPNWETFHFTYYVGENLIKKKYGQEISPENYKDLLVNSYIPSNFM